MKMTRFKKSAESLVYWGQLILKFTFYAKVLTLIVNCIESKIMYLPPLKT